MGLYYLEDLKGIVTTSVKVIIIYGVTKLWSVLSYRIINLIFRNMLMLFLSHCYYHHHLLIIIAVKHSADVNKADHKGLSPLIQACKSKEKVDTVRNIIKQKDCNINQQVCVWFSTELVSRPQTNSTLRKQSRSDEVVHVYLYPFYWNGWFSLIGDTHRYEDTTLPLCKILWNIHSISQLSSHTQWEDKPLVVRSKQTLGPPPIFRLINHEHISEFHCTTARLPQLWSFVGLKYRLLQNTTYLSL